MLTDRQKEVASRVARCQSTKAIARELGLAVRTVETHISNAAARIPGEGRPREKLIATFRLSDSDAA